MKLNRKTIATIAAFAAIFAVATMQSSQAQAGFFGSGWWGVAGMTLGSGR